MNGDDTIEEREELLPNPNPNHNPNDNNNNNNNYDDNSAATPNLKRHLTARHINMIAIGGTIGTGLFLGAGATLAIAGPGGSLLGFTLVSFLVWCIMNSLGELATYMPVSGSFTTYAGLLIDPALSFALGWNYWLQWSVSFPSELSAAGIILSFWAPSYIPSVVWSAAILIILMSVHLFGVKGFGECEYWLSLIKVVAIVLFIITGFLVDLGVLGGGGSLNNVVSSAFSRTLPSTAQTNSSVIGFENWTIEGAPFKNGLEGFFKVLLLAFFAFGGTELIGITAGEAQDPQKTIPKAIKQTFWRIWLFYIVSVFVMGLVIRNDDPSLLQVGNVAIAPFTLIFQRAGLSFAANFMNGVVFSAVLSAGNSALFAASRTLMALSSEGKAPAIFSICNSRGVPVYSILMTGLFGSISFLAIFWGDGALFLLLIQVTGISGILTWLSIAVIHIRFRCAFSAQKLDVSQHLTFMAPFYPFGPILALILGSGIIAGQAWASYNQSVLVFFTTFSGLLLFVLGYAGYKILIGTRLVDLESVDLDAMARIGYDIDIDIV